MEIKQWDNGEKYLSHCSWKISEDCEDRYKDKEALERKAKKEGIEKISSGICKKCLAILNLHEKNER